MKKHKNSGGHYVYDIKQKVYVYPKAISEFTDTTTGETWVNLDNGNTMSLVNYNLHYADPQKSKPLPKGTQDQKNPLKSDIHLKRNQ